MQLISTLEIKIEVPSQFPILPPNITNFPQPNTNAPIHN